MKGVTLKQHSAVSAFLGIFWSFKNSQTVECLRKALCVIAFYLDGCIFSQFISVYHNKSHNFSCKLYFVTSAKSYYWILEYVICT